jgi:o-succinylbenzoate synthase
MKIASVELIPLGLRFREPYVTARGTLESREMILLRLRTDEGHVGLGEAVPLTLRGGATLQRAYRALRRAVRRLNGLDIAPIASDEPLAGAVDTMIHVAAGRRLPPPAKAAVEMALFDLAGRISGQPVWRLLRADACTPVRCNATLAAGAPSSVAEQAAQWVERGFGAVKLKVGSGTDDRQAAAVRGAVGENVLIRVDANGTWTADEAIHALRGLEPVGIELAEQPVPTLRDLATVAAASAIPIAADESVTKAKEATDAVRRGACAYATVKLAKVGGIGPASSIAAEIPVYLSSALDGPVGIAAAAHAAQVIYAGGREDPGLAHGLATELLFAETIASVECQVQDGRLHVPEGPGLGVEIDDDALSRCRLDS